MPIFKIQKRNGSIDSFDAKRIYDAIKKAIIAADGSDFSHIDRMVQKVIKSLEEQKILIPNVETIQDIIESVLIKE
jgi:hypothetical protein